MFHHNNNNNNNDNSLLKVVIEWEDYRRLKVSSSPPFITAACNTADKENRFLSYYFPSIFREDHNNNSKQGADDNYDPHHYDVRPRWDGQRRLFQWSNVFHQYLLSSSPLVLADTQWDQCYRHPSLLYSFLLAHHHHHHHYPTIHHNGVEKGHSLSYSGATVKRRNRLYYWMKQLSMEGSVTVLVSERGIKEESGIEPIGQETVARMDWLHYLMAQTADDMERRYHLSLSSSSSSSSSSFDDNAARVSSALYYLLFPELEGSPSSFCLLYHWLTYMLGLPSLFPSTSTSHHHHNNVSLKSIQEKVNFYYEAIKYYHTNFHLQVIGGTVKGTEEANINNNNNNISIQSAFVLSSTCFVLTESDERCTDGYSVDLTEGVPYYCYARQRTEEEEINDTEESVKKKKNKVYLILFRIDPTGGWLLPTTTTTTTSDRIGNNNNNTKRHLYNSKCYFDSTFYNDRHCEGEKEGNHCKEEITFLEAQLSEAGTTTVLPREEGTTHHHREGDVMDVLYAALRDSPIALHGGNPLEWRAVLRLYVYLYELQLALAVSDESIQFILVSPELVPPWWKTVLTEYRESLSEWLSPLYQTASPPEGEVVLVDGIRIDDYTRLFHTLFLQDPHRYPFGGPLTISWGHLRERDTRWCPRPGSPTTATIGVAIPLAYLVLDSETNVFFMPPGQQAASFQGASLSRFHTLQKKYDVRERQWEQLVQRRLPHLTRERRVLLFRLEEERGRGGASYSHGLLRTRTLQSHHKHHSLTTILLKVLHSLKQSFSTKPPYPSLSLVLGGEGFYASLSRTLLNLLRQWVADPIHHSSSSSSSSATERTVTLFLNGVPLSSLPREGDTAVLREVLLYLAVSLLAIPLRAVEHSVKEGYQQRILSPPREATDLLSLLKQPYSDTKKDKKSSNNHHHHYNSNGVVLGGGYRRSDDYPQYTSSDRVSQHFYESFCAFVFSNDAEKKEYFLSLLPERPLHSPYEEPCGSTSASLHPPPRPSLRWEPSATLEDVVREGVILCTQWLAL